MKKSNAEYSKQIKKAFLEKWQNPDSRVIVTGSQGCQAFILWLEILPETGKAFKDMLK